MTPLLILAFIVYALVMVVSCWGLVTEIRKHPRKTKHPVWFCDYCMEVRRAVGRGHGSGRWHRSTDEALRELNIARGHNCLEQGCKHASAVPVNGALTDELLAWLCLDCGRQLPAEWNPT